jgi:hypothetical protein
MNARAKGCAQSEVRLASTDLQKLSLILSDFDDLYSLISNLEEFFFRNIHIKKSEGLLVSKPLLGAYVLLKVSALTTK